MQVLTRNASSASRGSVKYALRNHAFAFDNPNVAIQRNVGNLVHLLARGGPVNLDAIYLCGFADPQHFPGVVRRKIAAAVVLEAGTFLAGRGPVDLSANRVAVARYAFELETHPVAARSGVVLQQHRSAAVVCHEHVY